MIKSCVHCLHLNSPIWLEDYCEKCKKPFKEENPKVKYKKPKAYHLKPEFDENHTYKTCCTCKEEKLLTQFRKGRGKFGKINYCKPCHNEYSKKNYEGRRGSYIENQKKWNTANPEKCDAAVKKYCEKKKLERRAKKAAKLQEVALNK